MSIKLDYTYDINQEKSDLQADLKSNIGTIDSGISAKFNLNHKNKNNNFYKGIVLKSDHNLFNFEVGFFEDDNNDSIIQADGNLNLKSNLLNSRLGIKYKKKLKDNIIDDELSGYIEGSVGSKTRKIGINYETTLDGNIISKVKNMKQHNSIVTPFLETENKNITGRVGLAKKNNYQVDIYGNNKKLDTLYLNLKTNINY